MNLLHIFMFLLFAIGILLLMITLSADSKLGTDCTSKDLRTKLRMAIILGTVFLTISLGYAVCVMKKGCKCDFGQRATWKIYTMLAVLMGMGGFLLYLTLGIHSDLKKDGCKVDLGVIPTILMWLSIVQIVLPIMYIAYIVYTGKKPKGTKKKVVEPEDDDDVSELRALAEESTQLVDEKKDLNKDLSKLRIKLGSQKKKARSSKKNDLRTDIATTQAQIAKKQKAIKTIDSQLSNVQSQLSGGESEEESPFGSGFTFPRSR